MAAKPETSAPLPFGQEVVTGKATVLGGGAFGTCMATHLGHKGLDVALWMRDDNTVANVNEKHENTKYLPGIPLSEKVVATKDLDGALKGSDLVLVAIPTPFLRSFICDNRTALPVGVPIVLLCKGIENETLSNPYEILRDELPGKYANWLSCISGPSFATEVARGLLTNVTCAAVNLEVARLIQRIIATKTFRVYCNTDIQGVEVAGALKNVLAIASGACDGLGLGANARAALITRGLGEIRRMVIAKGGDAMTLLGLAGVGDLTLTCSSSQSRNYTVGFQLARGNTLNEIIASMNQVAEGVKTSKSVHEMMAQLNLDMPICEGVYKVLYEGYSVQDSFHIMLDRPLGLEVE